MLLNLAVPNSLKIAAYFLGTLFLGALLAPPLYWAGHAVAAWGPLHKLGEFEFRRYFDRAMLVAALVLLWPAVRALRVGSWRDLGLRPDGRRWRHLALGFALAAGGLWLLGLGFVEMGWYGPRKVVPWGAMLGFLVAAAAVACVEEGFFRGALQGLVGRTASAAGALVFVAALFAVLHFLKPPEGAVDLGEIGWWSGFEYLPRVFWQWGDLRLVLGGLATLFAVGLVLGYARWRTQALWLPVGLHAGWVFALKSFSATTRHTAPNNLWIGESLYYGLAPLAVVVLTGLLVAAGLRRETAAG